MNSGTRQSEGRAYPSLNPATRSVSCYTRDMTALYPVPVLLALQKEPRRAISATMQCSYALQPMTRLKWQRSVRVMKLLK